MELLKADAYQTRMRIALPGLTPGNFHVYGTYSTHKEAQDWADEMKKHYIHREFEIKHIITWVPKGLAVTYVR